jgi:methionyl-tRNA formyltransferase
VVASVIATPSLRVVFFGTPGFAVPTLDALVASTHHVVGVVTQPDRPRGRGQQTKPEAVKARALGAGLPILQPESLKDPEAVDALARLGADIGVVAAYGKILPSTVLALPAYGLINVHASLLPRHRGAAPVHRAIIAGDTETGVTIMRVVLALDAGPMFSSVHRSVGPDETSAEVEADLARLGASLLVTTLDALARGEAHETPQDALLATYAHRLSREDGLIDWTRTPTHIHDQIRGLHPWPHAYAYLGAQRIILRRSHVRPEPPTDEPGTITFARGDEIFVATGSGTLALTELQLEGRKPLRARDFLAGHPLAAGDRLRSTP